MHNPNFEIAYELSGLYRYLQQPAQVNAVLMKGMEDLPKLDTIKYRPYNL